MNTYHCESRAHCRTCLSDPEWRRRAGMPDVCPFGVTRAVIPPVRPAPESLASKRMAACRACGDWAATKCGRYRSTACRFKTYLARPGAVCLAALGVGGQTRASPWPDC